MTSSSVEQEKYFASLVATTPMGASCAAADTSMSDSLTSLDSLVMSAAAGDGVMMPVTPDSIRRNANPITRAVTTLRSSGGKMKCKYSGVHIRARRVFSASAVQHHIQVGTCQKGFTDIDS